MTDIVDKDQDKSDKDRLLFTKQTLAMNTQQFASVLGVSMTTLYDWIDCKAIISLTERKAMVSLEELAKLWQRLSNRRLRQSIMQQGGTLDEFYAILSSKSGERFDHAEAYLVELASKVRPIRKIKLGELIRNGKLEALPDHIRRAEQGTRMPCVSLNQAIR
ncbi:MAG: hypothetical protein ACSHX6_01310 [Akkermansiaceae bacterium]